MWYGYYSPDIFMVKSITFFSFMHILFLPLLVNTWIDSLKIVYNFRGWIKFGIHQLKVETMHLYVVYVKYNV